MTRFFSSGRTPLTDPATGRRVLHRPDLRGMVSPEISAAPLGPDEIDYDELTVHRTWRTYDPDKPGEVRYMMYELSQRNPGEALAQVFYKAVRLVRLTRVPRYLRDNAGAVFEQQRDVMAALREQQVLFINVIAKSPKLPLVFGYGVQAVGATPAEAQALADVSYEVLCAQLDGTYQQLFYSPLSVTEGELLARYQAEWGQIVAARGRPLPTATTLGGSALLDGNRTDSEMASNQLESFIRGMSDRSFMLSLVTVPLSPMEMSTAWRNISQHLSRVRSDQQGTRGYSAGVAMPIALGLNNGDSSGSTHQTGDSFGTGTTDTHSHSNAAGTSTSQTDGTNASYTTGTSSGTSHSLTDGTSQGVSSGTSTSVGDSSTHTDSASTAVGQSHSDGTSTSDGTTVTTGSTHTTGSSISNAHGTSTSDGTSHSSTSGSSWGTSTGKSMTGTVSDSGSYGGSSSDSLSNSISRGSTTGDSLSTSDGTSSGSGVNVGVLGAGGNSASGSSHSSSGGRSSSDTLGTSVSGGSSHGSNWGTSHGYSSATGVSVGQNYGGSTSDTSGTSHTTGTSDTVTTGTSVSNATSNSTAVSSTTGRNTTDGTSVTGTTGTSDAVGTTSSRGTNEGTNSGTSRSVGVGDSQTSSQSNATGTSSTAGTGTNSTKTDGSSNAASTSQGQSDAWAMAMTRSVGQSTSLAVSPTVGVSYTKTTFDEGKRVLGDLLEAQMQRYLEGVRSGAFLYQMFLVCPDQDTLRGASGLLKSAFWGDSGAPMPQPFHVISDFDDDERDRLLTHARAFTSYRKREPEANLVEPFLYSSYVTPTELSAFTHPPVTEALGLLAVHDSMPVLAMPADRAGRDLFVGHIVNGERGNVSDARYGMDVSELTHTLFSGLTGSGKTTTVMRFLSELSRYRRTVVTPPTPANPVVQSKQVPASILGIDWMTNMRDLAGVVEPDRFRFYSVAKPQLGRFSWNPLAVPDDSMSPAEWLNSQADNFVAAMNLGEYGRSLLAEMITELYSANRLVPYVLRPAKVDPETGDIVQSALTLAPVDEATLPKGAIRTANDGTRVANVFTCPALSRLLSIQHLAVLVAAKVEELATPEGGRLYGTAMRDRLQSLWRRMAYFAPGGQFEGLLTCDPSLTERTTLSVKDLIDPDKGLVTIIETDGLDIPNRRLILGSVILAVYRYGLHHGEGTFDQGGQGPGTFVVLEEAHELFGERGEDEDGFSVATRTALYDSLFRRARALGLRLSAIVQNPGAIPEAITSQTNSCFVHNTKAEADRKRVFSLLNWSNAIGQQQREWRYLGEMPIGYCIVRMPAKTSFLESAPVQILTDPAGLAKVTDQTLATLAAARGV